MQSQFRSKYTTNKLTPYIKKMLYIQADGTPDTIRFQNHICEFISIFVTQLIIHRIIHNIKPNLNTSQSKPSDEIQPIPVEINSDILNELKASTKEIPQYALQQYNDIMNPKSRIYKSLKLLFNNMPTNITTCETIIKDQAIARFSAPGATMIAERNPDTKEIETRVANPSNTFNEDFMKRIQLFEDDVRENIIGDENIDNENIDDENEYKQDDNTPNQYKHVALLPNLDKIIDNFGIKHELNNSQIKQIKSYYISLQQGGKFKFLNQLKNTMKSKKVYKPKKTRKVKK